MGGETPNNRLNVLTLFDALLQLAAVQQWIRLPLGTDGTPYSINFFERKRETLFKTITNDNRKVAFRQIRIENCIMCNSNPVSRNGVSDHLICRKCDGVDNAANYGPFCSRCNSSKGKKDLFEWLLYKKFDFTRFSEPAWLDVIVAYVRLVYQHSISDELFKPAPSYLRNALNRFFVSPILQKEGGGVVRTTDEVAEAIYELRATPEEKDALLLNG